MRANLTEEEHFLVTPSVFLIIIGFVMVTFAYFGFVGALRDNFLLLKIVSLFCCMFLFVVVADNKMKLNQFIFAVLYLVLLVSASLENLAMQIWPWTSPSMAFKADDYPK